MLDFTGERFLPEVGAQMAYEHYSRYLYAQSLVAGKIVLDCPCGEGFGSDLLAFKAAKVHALDISEESIEHCRTKYLKSNLQFDVGDMTDLASFADNLFDVVVCMEGIEHISAEKQAAALREFKRVLKPSGKLLISTPNRKVYTDLSGVVNKFHVNEFYIDEYRNFLKSEFKHVKMLGQSIVTACPLLDIDGGEAEELHVSFYGSHEQIAIPRSSLGDVWWYIVAVCTNGVDDIKMGGLFVDFLKRTEKELVSDYQVALDKTHLIKGNLEEANVVLTRKLSVLEGQLLALKIEGENTPLRLVLKRKVVKLLKKLNWI